MSKITIPCPHCDGAGRVPNGKHKDQVCYTCDGRKVATEKEIFDNLVLCIDAGTRPDASEKYLEEPYFSRKIDALKQIKVMILNKSLADGAIRSKEREIARLQEEIDALNG